MEQEEEDRGVENILKKGKRQRGSWQQVRYIIFHVGQVKQCTVQYMFK